MKTYRNTTLAACVLLMLGACASGPASTGLLEQTRMDYAQAQGNPKIATYAALEMQAATQAMATANTAAAKHESIGEMDRLAYLAKQKIALANEVASRKSAESDIANAAGVRDQVRLEQRTLEADQARMKAQDAQRAEQAARTDASLATQQKEQAQVATADAQRQADEARARNAVLEEQLASLAAKKTERGLVITLGDVLFGTDLSRLNAQGMQMAQRLADVLKTNPARKVLVEGFADSTGTSEHNQALSERRAIAVRSALLELGVAGERVAIRGYGESMPVAANDTAQNRQLNRRVEIILSDERGVIAQR